MPLKEPALSASQPRADADAAVLSGARRASRLGGAGGIEAVGPTDTLRYSPRSVAQRKRVEATFGCAARHVAQAVGDPDTPQYLGTGVEGAVPMNERRFVKLTMSQAVVADLRQLSLFSDNFSSCSPVAMFNAGTSRGGLFHFPGSGLASNSKEDTKRRLKQMYDDVAPTQVWLNDRFKEPQMGGFIPGQPSDVEPITECLQEFGYAGPISLIAGQGDRYALYLDAHGAPQAMMGGVPGQTGAVVSAMKDRTREEREALGRAWEGLPKATKYGVDQFSHLAR